MTTTAVDPLVQYTEGIPERPIPDALLAARRDVMAAVADLATIREADLEKVWAWKGDSEIELRYAFYRILEDFERAGIDAAATLRTAGVERGRAAELIAPSTAARWDLQGLLLQLPDAAWEAKPGGEEWTVRETLGHIIASQRGYAAVTAWWQREGLPADVNLPTARPSHVYDPLPSDEEEAAGTPAEVRARLDEVLDHSTERLAGLPPERLAYGTRWVGFALDIGFRLGRWSSHFREHTVQVEKTLVMLGHTPSEVERLIRLVLAEWGRAEAVVYGSADGGEAVGVLAGAAAAARITASETAWTDTTVVPMRRGDNCPVRAQTDAAAMPKVSDAIRLVESHGWRWIRTRGSHRQYRHPDRSGRVTIAGRPSRELPPGTFRSILRQAGIDTKEDR
jgi:predicted RNA binding protein YcfA (HicA-like mRNA interferase family)